MKKVLPILPILLALAVGVVVGAIAFRGGDAGHDHAAAEAAGGDEAAGEIWTCSMHPQVKAPKPGKCPICAMDLIPLSDLGGAGVGREFSLSEEAKVLAGIVTAEVERRHPEAKVRLYGRVVYDETRRKTIAARFPGRIERLFVDYTGIQVEQGDHLATIYSPELLSAQSELLTAKRFGKADSIRIARDKLRLWGFSESRIEEIEASGEASDHLTIEAPVSGIVTHKQVDEGDYVETGKALFQINDLEEVWVMFDAYESDMPWVRFGQQVEFTAEALPGRVLEGRISFIAPQIDPETRTFDVRVTFENEGELLRPGMFVRGTVTATVAGAGRVIDPSLAGKWISPMHPEIIKDEPGKCDVCGMDLVPAEELGYVSADEEGRAPLVIPASAVLHTGNRSVVYVENPDVESSSYEGREVLLGPRADDVYLVEAGLREGERVVAEGAFAIDSSLQIQARPSMMLPPDEEAPLFRSFEAPDEFLTKVDEVTRAYFDVQKALADDDLEAAKQRAEALRNSLSDRLIALPEEEAAEAWLEIQEALSSSAAAIEEASKIEEARAPFEPLSVAAEEMILRFGTGDLDVYKAHCPMAFGNQGADWLQEDETILNPYFGASMLKCGEITEQLASPASDE
ncbi:MAG: efflux RND transporter periplasmic adaptor subunit [Verrucomicrobiales bacterium]